MNIGKLVAVRYIDGRIHKGRTSDFMPQRPYFHLRPDDGAEPLKVETKDLKAIFFIKSEQGNPSHEEQKDFAEAHTAEKKIWIQFSDGEELAGWSSAFASGKIGFYFTPTDSESNLERVFVFRESLVRLLTGDEAEIAAQKYQDRQAMKSKQ